MKFFKKKESNKIHLEILHSIKFKNKEMDEFQNSHDPRKFNQDEINNLNRSITRTGWWKLIPLMRRGEQVSLAHGKVCWNKSLLGIHRDQSYLEQETYYEQRGDTGISASKALVMWGEEKKRWRCHRLEEAKETGQLWLLMSTGLRKAKCHEIYYSVPSAKSSRTADISSHHPISNFCE